MSLEEALAKARGSAKRDLIAQAAVIAREFGKAADRVDGHIARLKRKEIDEWEMVEALHEEIFGIFGELALTGLTKKLVLFQLTDLEKRRVEIAASRRDAA